VEEEEEKAPILATHLVPHSAEQPLVGALVSYRWAPHSCQRNLKTKNSVEKTGKILSNIMYNSNKIKPRTISVMLIK
jgi:hypothetical protein